MACSPDNSLSLFSSLLSPLSLDRFLGVEDLSRSSALYNAIVNKNMQAAELLVQCGATLSDNSYRRLCSGRKLARLLAVVQHHVLIEGKKIKKNVNETCSSSSSSFSSSFFSSPRVWHPSAAWSFPRSWYVGVRWLSLCWQRRRMSSDVLRTVLLVLLDRGWFVVVEDSSSSSSLPILARVRPNFDC